MTCDRFRGNRRPTLGIEIELQLVDSGTMALRSAIAEILADLPEGLEDSVKPEFLQCYVEINTEVGHCVADVEADLARKVLAVEEVASRHGMNLLWAATHPFSRWRDQRITPNARYYELADLLQETVRRPVTFGLHVHVGVESGDKAILIGNRIQEYLPALLALSANSPLWQGRPTGLQAHRIELLEGFPTGGLPPLMRGWDDYVGLVDRLAASGFIKTTHELWWDIRPSHEHGTVEVRICDMPPDLPSVGALAALTQCLVHHLAREIDRGVDGGECHPLMVHQNRWRAARYGLDASLVDARTLEARPARDLLKGLIERLMPVAESLRCAGHLGRVMTMAEAPTGAERQLAIFEQTGDPAEVVRRLAAQSSLLRPPEILDGTPAGPPLNGDRSHFVLSI